MNELLSKLLANDLLNEETKSNLTEGIKNYLVEFELTRTAEIRESLLESMSTEISKTRQILIDAMDEQLNATIKENFDFVKDDIASFRNLDEEYKEQFAKAKLVLAEEFAADKNKLIQDMHECIDSECQNGFKALHEDICEVKRHGFGKKIFDAFKDEFKNSVHDNSDDKVKINDLKTEIDSAKDELEKSKGEIDTHKANYEDALAECSRLKREIAINECLQNVKGESREQLRIMLEHTTTDKLKDTSQRFINKLLNSTVANNKVATSVQSQVVLESGINNKNNVVHTRNAVPADVTINDIF